MMHLLVAVVCLTVPAATETGYLPDYKTAYEGAAAGRPSYTEMPQNNPPGVYRLYRDENTGIVMRRFAWAIRTKPTGGEVVEMPDGLVQPRRLPFIQPPPLFQRPYMRPCPT